MKIPHWKHTSIYNLALMVHIVIICECNRWVTVMLSMYQYIYSCLYYNNECGIWVMIGSGSDHSRRYILVWILVCFQRHVNFLVV